MPSRIYDASDDWDPLTNAISPPPDESAQEREDRIKQELEAKQKSDAIDEDLNRQRVLERKGPKPVRVLLLGQSESGYEGKSTFLKFFKLMHDPKAFSAERASWRAVIQLNVVRSIHIILDAMTHPSQSRHNHRAVTKEIVSSTSSSPLSGEIPLPEDTSEIEPELIEIRSRLSALLQIEDLLTRRLTPKDYSEVGTTQLAPVYPLKHVQTELAINSSVPWKQRFDRLVGKGDTERMIIDWDDPNDPGKTLHACGEDMIRLWKHPLVQQMLEKQNLRLEEMAGFFLDSLPDITAERYLPTDEHILRARLKTLGVSEHQIKGAMLAVTGEYLMLEDIGLCEASPCAPFLFLNQLIRVYSTNLAAWAPFFENNLNAIIFLAPISAFDQVLAEAPKVNRLEDSVSLWTSIVANKILQHTDLILFLNKCDLMAAKLASGIKLKDYVVSYGNRPNDFESTTNYLRKKFAGILKENSPLPRTFYCHYTSVTDALSTQKVIASIKDMLMRDTLKNSTLLL
ncbi:guanine nucleotide binding protein, alpha subunit [Lentinula detonsa]|uniref:Guanine nucleotide binding protein, alpha subunit n=1 Tax=Lentinula detonsa TaxID=2804962 RepID=A0AA38UUQ0_9AGAR|nr:guanine nucleotide binding protein, alpha subunit [Lentinula detonsa]